MKKKLILAVVFATLAGSCQQQQGKTEDQGMPEQKKEMKQEHYRDESCCEAEQPKAFPKEEKVLEKQKTVLTPEVKSEKTE